MVREIGTGMMGPASPLVPPPEELTFLKVRLFTAGAFLMRMAGMKRARSAPGKNYKRFGLSALVAKNSMRKEL